MNTNTLISDFKDVPKISYKDYEHLKAYQLLSVQGIPSDYRIRKTHNKLYINSKSYNLEDLSVSSVINLLLDNVPNLEAYRYEENSIEYLDVSSLFITDFDTLKVVEYSFSKDSFNDYWVDEHIDKFNSSYILSDFKILNQARVEVPYTRNGNKILVQSNIAQNFKMFCNYKATDLKINLMQEFPISNTSQLFTMSKDTY